MLESIMDRRSIRRYTSEPVTENEIRTLLECAMLAPSAKDGRPWSFIVIDDREILDKIAESQPFASSLRTAPVCICVCGKEGDIPGYYQQDCAAATMNILNSAKEIGLGTCWMGVAPRRERMDAVRAILGIPEDVCPFSLIAVGHPDEQRPRPERWDEARVHRNKW